jgi:hypothetical protein
MDRERFVRRLKFAWSTSLGVLCVLFLVLWARSYSHYDWLGPGITYSPEHPGPNPRVFVETSGFLFESARGAVVLRYVGNLSPHAWYAWHWGSFPAGPLALRFAGDGGESASDGFRAERTPNGTIHGAAPHWCLALVSGLLAASVWIRRFSVRGLLIATAMLALVLALAKLAQRIDWGEPRHSEQDMEWSHTTVGDV